MRSIDIVRTIIFISFSVYYQIRVDAYTYYVYAPTQESCQSEFETRTPNIQFCDHRINYGWTIEYFSFKEITTTCIVSPTFSAATLKPLQLQWFLKLYPNWPSGSISVFLNLVPNNEIRNVHGRFRLSILNNQNVKVVESKTIDFNIGNSYSVGITNFVPKDWYFRNIMWLSNDKLTIYSEVAFSCEEIIVEYECLYRAYAPFYGRRKRNSFLARIRRSLKGTCDRVMSIFG